MGVCQSRKSSKSSDSDAKAKQTTSRAFDTTKPTTQNAQLPKFLSQQLSPEVTPLQSPNACTFEDLKSKREGRVQFTPRCSSTFSQQYTLIHSRKNCSSKHPNQFGEHLFQENSTGKTVLINFLDNQNLELNTFFQGLFDANIAHPYITKILAMKTDKGSKKVVQEYSEFGTLGSLINGKKLSQKDILTIIIQMLEVLEYCEEKDLPIKLVSLDSIDVYQREPEIWIKFKLKCFRGDPKSKAALKAELAQCVYQLMTGEQVDSHHSICFDKLATLNYDQEVMDFAHQFFFLGTQLSSMLLSPVVARYRQNMKDELLSDLFEKFKEQDLTYLEFCCLVLMINKFQPAEYERAYLKFQLIKHNSITLSDYLDYEDRMELGKSKKDCRRMFKLANINKDGSIDLQEFLVQTLDWNLLATPSNIRVTFDFLVNHKFDFLTPQSFNGKIRFDVDLIKGCFQELQLKKIYINDFELIFAQLQKANRKMQH